MKATEQTHSLKLKLMKNKEEVFIPLPSAKVLFLIRFISILFVFLLAFIILYMLHSIYDLRFFCYFVGGLSCIGLFLLAWLAGIFFSSFKLSFKDKKVALYQKIFGFYRKKWEISASDINNVYIDESLKFPLLHIIGEDNLIILGPRFLLNQKDFFFLREQILDYIES